VVVAIIRSSFEGPTAGSTTAVNATVRFTEFEALEALQRDRLEDAASQAEPGAPTPLPR
jgi:hypothetical protein